MTDTKRVLDLGSLRITVFLGLSGFVILVLIFEDTDILQWKGLSQWKDASSNWTKGGETVGRNNIDSSCISRSSQHLYRQNTVARVSSTLLESWERYVTMHGKCSQSNWTEVLSGKSLNRSCKFIIYIETHEGLGNRILSLLSALLYSIITDRVLMIDSRKEVGEILCEPFGGSSWLLPADFPYELVKRAPDLGQAIDKNFSVPVVHLQLSHVQKGTDAFFFCDEAQQSLTQVRTLAWSSNQYFVTSFFRVPWLWTRLVSLFPGPRLDIFWQLSSLAISPVNSIWSLISRFHESYLSCSRHRIGLQIRAHSRPDLSEFDPLVKEIVFKCLTNHGLLPNLSSSSQDLEQQRRQRREVDLSVLVASLQGKYYETLRNEFLRNGTVSRELVSFHSLSSEEFERHDLHQASLALAEMWLLSFGHDIVTSEYSTFGYIARGLAHSKTWMMKIRGSGIRSDGEVCYLSQSTEPCTHFPQAPRCPGSKILSQEHSEWIRRHIGECQDQRGGIQLLD